MQYIKIIIPYNIKEIFYIHVLYILLEINVESKVLYARRENYVDFFKSHN